MSRLPTKVATALVTYRHLLLASTVVSVFVLPQLSSAFEGTADERPIMLAQKEDPKKKKEKEAPRKEAPKREQPRPPAGAGGQPGGDPRQTGQPPRGAGDRPQGAPKQTGEPPRGGRDGQPGGVPKQKQTVQPPKGPIQQQQGGGGGQQQTGQPEPKLSPKQTGKPGDPKQQRPEQQQTGQPEPKLSPKQTGKPGDPKQQRPEQQQTGQPEPKPSPKQTGKPMDPRLAPKESFQKRPGEPPPGMQKFGQPQPKTGPQFDSVDDIRNRRKETRDKSGRVVITEPGGRRIIREGNRRVIIRDDGERMRRWGNARVDVRGAERYTIVRRGPYEIVTVTDVNGRLLRRFRRGSDGREHVLIDNRRRGIGVGGAVALGGIVALGLMAPRISMPRERYIVDAREAPPTLLYEALEEPVAAPIERAYTFDEIRDNVELRAHVRSIDINTINFASGSWELSPEQIPQLEALAEAMLKVIGENPDTVFLIEGHTDAVGAPEDNLSLSDRRAETIAEILTTHFQVPPENLMTQGYGEQHLRVQTEGPSQENRRVEVRNITPLLAGKSG